MCFKLLTEHHLEFREAAEASPSLHMSKCHIVGNNMPRFNYSILKGFKKSTTCLNANLCRKLDIFIL